MFKSIALHSTSYIRGLTQVLCLLCLITYSWPSDGDQKVTYKVRSRHQLAPIQCPGKSYAEQWVTFQRMAHWTPLRRQSALILKGMFTLMKISGSHSPYNELSVYRILSQVVVLLQRNNEALEFSMKSCVAIKNWIPHLDFFFFK